MPVRVRYKLEISISSSSAEEKDLGNGKYEVVVDSQNEGGSWKTVVPAGAVDTQIQLPNVASAKFLVVRSTPKNPLDAPSTVQLKKNSNSGEIIGIAPMGGSKEAYFLICSDGITALYASNPGTVAMELTVFVAGD